MPSRPGVSLRSFSRLENELIVVARRLSNRQLLELADDFHAMLRERRALRGAARKGQPFTGSNDNTPSGGRR